MDGSAAVGSSRPARLLRDQRLVSVVLVSMVGILGVAIASPALPAIASGLGVPEARTGLVISAFFLPSVVAVPVVGVLTDIYGRRRFVLGGLVTFGLAGASIAFVESFAALLILRAVQGIGYAGLTPLAITVTGDLYTGPDGSAAQGLRESAHGAGQLLLPAAAGLLAGVSWQVPFLLYAIAFPVLAVALVYLPETAPGGDGGFESGRVLAELREYGEAVRSEAVDRTIAVLMVGGFVVFFLKLAVLTFVPLFAVRSLGASLFVAGVVLSIRGVVRLLGAPLAGSLVAAVPRDRGLGGVIAVAAAGAALIPFAPSVAWLAAAFTLYCAGSVLMTPILNDSVAAAAAVDQRGGIVSAFNITKSVAMVTAPAALGLVLTAADFTAVFAVAAGVALVYTVGLVVVLRPGFAA